MPCIPKKYNCHCPEQFLSVAQIMFPQCSHRRVQMGGQGVLTPPFPGPPLFICDPSLPPNPISQKNVMKIVS